MKKILYLSYDGLTDPLGQSQILPYLIGLAKKGFQFTIISFEKQEAFLLNGDTIKEICDSNEIKWHPLYYTKTPPVLSTIKDLYKLRKAVVRLHKKENFALIHCRSYLTSIIGLWAKKKLGTKFIFDMRGFWADERAEGKLWNLKNPLYKFIYTFFKKKEKQFLKEADYTVSLTNNGAEQIRSVVMRNNSIAPIQVIPCCVDLNLFDYKKIQQMDIEKQKRDLNINSDSVVLSYIGSIGTWYMLNEMLLFFKEWLKQFPKSIFLFITGDDPNKIIEKAKAIAIPAEYIRIVKGKRNEMPLLITCCNYSIFFIRPSFSKRASSPTKQGEIMAMGKPVICNAFVGDTDQVIEKYKAGVVVSEFSPNAYQRKIEELQQSKFDTELLRKGAEEFYSLEKGIEKYSEVYQRALGA